MALYVEEGEIVDELDDVRSKIDPDIAFSYLDERIDRVLGHFRKDFEGVISAQSLGPKFGGYGIFLPTYVRPPSMLFPPTATPITVQWSHEKNFNQKCLERDDQLSQSMSFDPTDDQRKLKLPVNMSSMPKNSEKNVLNSAKSMQSFHEKKVNKKCHARHDQLSQNKSLSATDDQRKLKLPVNVDSILKNSAKNVLNSAKSVQSSREKKVNKNCPTKDDKLSQDKSLNPTDDQRKLKLLVKVTSTPRNSAKNVLRSTKTGSNKKDALPLGA